ncbi:MULTISPECIES: thiamine pyrophosphate-binding protein [unclassified Streptomyces]|uniref:thiamine pyrophosphate-binding protein n=1 Tax=unclassified Streptomyces TaxID=2593676 RepID=UPI001904165B|nr:MULTISPECIES: thiamine pyrophosphate-binding protein [unclassified Streptomyces]MCU4745686.1 thiamine pyrophosphate-binding protein [Streptomyces sp. G-5]QQN79339.1 thiamine pyrophosphate-binding protein [Streptomyces sp. XC 2026]
MGHSSRTVDYVVGFLREQGLHDVFGVDGANIEDLYDAVALAGAPLRALVAKHEFSAATMADGYHRAAGRPAVVAATSGAGAMNLVPGLAELRASQVPALALIGQPPAALDGTGTFQETSGLAGTMDAERLFAEIGVFCARVTEPDRIVEVLPRALEAALAAPGPAVLLLPKDVQQSVLGAWPERIARVGAPLRPLSAEPLRARAVTLLTDARTAGGPVVGEPGEERRNGGPDAETDAWKNTGDGAGHAAGGVVVLAGPGVIRADARAELAALCTALDADVAVAPDAKDVFDNTHPRCLGVLGPSGTPETDRRVAQASAVVVAGHRLPQMAGGSLRDHLKGVPVISVDGGDPPLLPAGHPALIRLTGPIAAELDALARALEPPAGRREPPGAAPGRPPMAADTATGAGRRPYVPAQRQAPVASAGQRTGAGALDLPTALDILARRLPENANLVVDAGNTGATTVHRVPAPRRGRFITALGMGGMGHSFGAGIGAALATGAPTYVVAGDGAFYMHGMEIHTAAELALPVTFLIVNNNAHAMCHTREQVFFTGDYTFNLFRPAHIGAGVAALFPGVRAHHATDAAELDRALAAPHDGRPVLISIDVDPHQVPPFRPFHTNR